MVDYYHTNLIYYKFYSTLYFILGQSRNEVGLKSNFVVER